MANQGPKGIAWTDTTWNPIIGCSRVSEGCRNCYAERIAARFGNGKATVYQGLTRIVNGRPVWSGKIVETRKLLEPLSWRRPRRVFVNSMSDLFHENVTDEQRDRIFAVMALTPQHTYQVLTKRPERMLRYMTEACTEDGGLRIGRAASSLSHGTSLRDRTLSLAEQAAVSNQFEWNELKHVWLGVSVEDQETADKRIPLLLKTPAAVRFLSCEPLLGPLDLENLPSASGIGRYLDALSNAGVDPGADIPTKLDWVIAGGESGPGARPCHQDWIRSLRDQCAAAKVPFFFKQWGEWLPYSQGARPCDRYGQYGLISLDGRRASLHHGTDMQDEEFGLYTFDLDGNDNDAAVYRVGKVRAGSKLDGKQWHEYPPQPEAVKGTEA